MICTTSAAPAALKARMSSTRVGPLVGDDRRPGRRGARAARPCASICASREPASNGCSTRSANGRARLLQLEDHALGVVAEQAVDVEVQDRRVGLARRAGAARGRAPSARRRRCCARELGRVDQPVRERVDPLEDHLVDVGAALLAGLRVDREAPRARGRGPTRPARRSAIVVPARARPRRAAPARARSAAAVPSTSASVSAERRDRARRADGASSSPSRAASSAARSRGSRPPTPLYCTLTQSPWATCPSLEHQQDRHGLRGRAHAGRVGEPVARARRP